MTQYHAFDSVLTNEAKKANRIDISSLKMETNECMKLIICRYGIELLIISLHSSQTSCE